MSIEEKPKITVRLSQDELEAYLLLPPLEADDAYTKEEVMEALDAKRVKVGIDENKIERMIAERCYGREELVATGEPAVDGVDGFYQYNFNCEVDKRPKIRPDGTVDYWSIHAIEVVDEGQVIAVYQEPVEGKNGLAVTGKVLMAKRGRPLPPLTGKGFQRSEDNRLYTASLTGKIESNGSRIQILPVYEIYGNVDLTTGNVDFRGDVVVHGNVVSGTSIKATNSVTIDGTAEACSIEAGKDIILRGGFLGGYRGSLKSGGNIYAKFMEYAKVEAEGCVEADSALNCNITCKDKVYMKGKKSTVIGGNIYGACGVEANCLGNEKEHKTEVKAGILTETLREIELCKNRIKEESEWLKKITEGLKSFDELAKAKNLDVGNDERRVALLRTRIAKQASLASEKDRLEYLKSLTERAKGATVRAEHEVYPGVNVSINDIRVHVREPQQSVEFVLHDDKVVMFSLKGELVG